MAVDLLRQGQAQAHEHGGPDNRVETDDLLAHKVDVRRPELVHIAVRIVHIAQGGHVVEQRVHPHIGNMLGVEVNGYAPGEAGAGYAQILQAGLDEVVDHLMDAAAGLQEVRVLQQVLDPVRVLGQAEEVSLLLRVLDGAAAVRALAVLELALGPEALAGRAVLALVGTLIDIPVLVHLFKDFLDGGDMVSVGGADEAVIADIHQLPQIQHTAGGDDDVVHKLLGRDPGLPGLVLDLLAMLVGAGEEHHLAAGQALVAGHGIGSYRAVGLANVETAGGVVDGRGDIKAIVFHRKTSCQPHMRGVYRSY